MIFEILMLRKSMKINLFEQRLRKAAREDRLGSLSNIYVPIEKYGSISEVNLILLFIKIDK